MICHFVVTMKNGREFEEDGRIEPLDGESVIPGKFFAIRCEDHVVLYNIDHIESIEITKT